MPGPASVRAVSDLAMPGPANVPAVSDLALPGPANVPAVSDLALPGPTNVPAVSDLALPGPANVRAVNVRANVQAMFAPGSVRVVSVRSSARTANRSGKDRSTGRLTASARRAISTLRASPVSSAPRPVWPSGAFGVDCWASGGQRSTDIRK